MFEPANPYNMNCPSRDMLDLIGGKWAILILCCLQQGPVRTGALMRQIGGISQKMLSQTLKSLERDGLVNRKAIPTVPVTVEYSITPLGRTLATAVDALRVWAETHIEEVLVAQQRYDAGAT